MVFTQPFSVTHIDHHVMVLTTVVLNALSNLRTARCHFVETAANQTKMFRQYLCSLTCDIAQPASRTPQGENLVIFIRVYFHIM